MRDENRRMLSDTRFARPEAVAEAAKKRRRRAAPGDSGRLLIIAADHTARGIIEVAPDSTAMGNRYELLDRLCTALSLPGVDGVLGTPDIIEDLLLLGALDDKVVFGSMNRGGLPGAVFEIDDRFTGYTPDSIVSSGLDGGKMLLRINPDDPGTVNTIVACADAVTRLAQAQRVAMLEPFMNKRTDGLVRNVLTADAVMRSMAIASALGATSAYTWLKVPVVDDMDPRRRGRDHAHRPARRRAQQRTPTRCSVGGKRRSACPACGGSSSDATCSTPPTTTSRPRSRPRSASYDPRGLPAVARPRRPTGGASTSRRRAPAGSTHPCKVLTLGPGQRVDFPTGESEWIVLPLAGRCDVTCEGETFELDGRPSVFERVTDFAYVPRESGAHDPQRRRAGASRLPGAVARRWLEPRYGAAADVPVELRGAGSASRQANNFAVARRASRPTGSIAVEVLVPGGQLGVVPAAQARRGAPRRGRARRDLLLRDPWRRRDATSRGPAGTSASTARRRTARSTCWPRSRTGDTVLIPYGYHGPTMAAPGYDLYFLNVLAGSAQPRTMAFCDDPTHAWIRGSWNSMDVDPRLPMTSHRGVS